MPRRRRTPDCHLARARAAKSLLGAGLSAAAVLCPAPARAHEVGLSRGEYAAEGPAVRAEVAFARKELIGLVAGLDRDHDGALSQAEIDAGRDSIEGAIVGRIKVSGGGAACPGELSGAALADQDGALIKAVYRCPRRPAEVSVTLGFMADLPFGHRHLGRARAAAGTLDFVLSQRNPTFVFPLPPPAPGEATLDIGRGALFQTGILHAARSWPIPVFLLGILLPAAGRTRALGTFAAFAAAFAAGLALAAHGIFAPGPRAAAAAIAASLVYAGADDLAGGDHRPWTAAPLGAAHGMGAAAALAALGSTGGVVMFGLGALAAAAAMAVLIAPAARRLRGRARAAAAAIVAAAGIAGLSAALYPLLLPLLLPP